MKNWQLLVKSQISHSVGPEYHVEIFSFVDKDQLKPCAIWMHNKVLSVVGLRQNEVNPMVSVMKFEKAPSELYADFGGLDMQNQELTEVVERPLTHPKLSENVGFKLPTWIVLYGKLEVGKTMFAKC
ncbi:hypothetical protein P3S68_026463 [Capsicum galapagoense]